MRPSTRAQMIRRVPAALPKALAPEDACVFQACGFAPYAV